MAAGMAASPAAVLELQLLHEIGRVAPAVATIMDTLARDIGLRVADERFDLIASAALAESWTRDPFDRLIVAHARYLDAVLLTRDRRITTSYANCRW